MDAPHAPWSLLGECFIGLCARRPGGPLPLGLHSLPGPCVIAAMRYSDSPVGPYTELWVGEPARLGARPGLCTTTMVTDSPMARVGGRLNWGLPTELGTLRWLWDPDGGEVRWEDRGVALRVRATGRRVPVVLPFRDLQRRADGPVTVPVRFRGNVRMARLEVDAPAGDPLARLAGHHRGAHVTGMRVVMEPARIPVGLTSTLLAPRTAPEPALSSVGQ